jgi:hypothetical protein
MGMRRKSMFKNMMDKVRGWFVDPRVDLLEQRMNLWHDKTWQRIGEISDGIDKNGDHSTKQMENLYDRLDTLEFLFRRVEAHVFPPKSKRGRPRGSKNKTVSVLTPAPAPKRGRPKGSKTGVAK